MAGSKVFRIGECSCQGLPTAGLNMKVLEEIRDFRTEGYAAILSNDDRQTVERYVDRSTDAWVDPNHGVERGVLRRGQVFGKSVVWLARRDDGSIAAEVLSANNASSSSEGFLGEVVRTAKMRLPVLPSRQAGKLVLKHTPYRVIREIFGPADIAAALLYMTARCEARPDQPMSAFMWEDEELTPKMPEWGFNLEGSEEISPLGKGGTLITEQSYRASSARVVADSVFGSSDVVHSMLWQMRDVKC